MCCCVCVFCVLCSAYSFVSASFLLCVFLFRWCAFVVVAFFFFDSLNWFACYDSVLFSLLSVVIVTVCICCLLLLCSCFGVRYVSFVRSSCVVVVVFLLRVVCFFRV